MSLLVAPQPSDSARFPRSSDESAVEFDAAAAAVIAHDFNNLLTTILGNLSLALLTAKLDSATQERLVTAKKAGLRAQELTQRLLMLGRASALPNAAGEPLPIEGPFAEAAPLAPPIPRVLVLDDEEAICTLVSYALESLGYEVVETHDALTAIERYTEALRAGRRFDVVISDLTIPGGIGGEEAVRRLREIDPDIKAIVSTGYSCDPILAEFRAHGFCAVIQKPYEIEALSRMIAEVLGERSPRARNVVEHEFAALATA